MTSERWFDNLTRALAGGGGRRSFLRLLMGGAAGAALGTVLPGETEAAPASQGPCSPRPRVQVTNTPTSTGLGVTVATTGSGNAIGRITFGTLRNGVIDVPGGPTGLGSNAVYTPPAAVTQLSFTVRALDTSAVVQVPFTVADGCGDWRTFVGTGAGVLTDPARVCPSYETTLTAAAPAGTTVLQIANPGCFKVGDKIVLDPGGSTQDQLDVVGVTVASAGRADGRVQATNGGAVQTSTGTTWPHVADARAQRRLPSGATCFRGLLFDPCARGDVCCSTSGQSATTGTCCRLGNCCDPDFSGHGDCYPDSFFASDRRNCGFCGNRCKDNEVCRNGKCVALCAAPDVACGRAGAEQCCRDATSHCSSVLFTNDSVCCFKTMVACGYVCCQSHEFCKNGTCTDCSCNTDTVDRTSNTCTKCGSGPPCDTSKGQVCVNGTCTCFGVINSGDKLCSLTCADGSGTTSGASCPADLTCCRDANGSFLCSDTTCGGGSLGTPTPPLCTKP